MASAFRIAVVVSVAATVVWGVNAVPESAPAPSAFPDVATGTIVEYPAPATEAPKINKWDVSTDYPLEVFEAQGTIMECNGAPHLVVFGGFLNFPDTTYQSFKRNVLDADAAWEKLADMPSDSPDPITHMAQAVVGDVIYLAGGYLGAHAGPSVKNAYMYNCTADKWTTLPDLPGPRAGAGMVYDEELNMLIFAGGGDRQTPGGPAAHIKAHIDYGTTWVLDLQNIEQGWDDLGPSALMPDPRNHQGGARACGRSFWIGGQHEEDEAAGNRATCNELVVDLDKGSFTWKAIADLPFGLGHISASTMPWKCGLVVVGGVMQQLERSMHVLFWNSVKDEWSIIGTYPVGLATPVCGVWEDTVYCATGSEAKDKMYVAHLDQVVGDAASTS